MSNSPYLTYKRIENFEEYLSYCKSLYRQPNKYTYYSLEKVKEQFACPDDWLTFFEVYELLDNESLEDRTDWDQIISNYTGDISLKPEPSDYPVLVVSLFEESMDGEVIIWDIVPIAQIQ